GPPAVRPGSDVSSAQERSPRAPERQWDDGRMAQELSPDVHPLDEHRDPSEVALVQSLAAQAASRHGADLTRMRRANGYSNATWVGDGIAVRIARPPSAWRAKRRWCVRCRARSAIRRSSGRASPRGTDGS